MLTVARNGDISLVVALVSPFLVLIGAISRVDHQMGLGLFLASPLQRHKGIDHDTLCLLVFIAARLFEVGQTVWLIVLVKVMASIDQH